jgi:hypothetical protein
VIRTPHPFHKAPSESWHRTEEDARAEFERRKTELMNGDGSALFRLELYIDNRLVDEDFLVRRVPNF